ncbi:MAG: hypothetical protein IKS93_06350 [Methanobrevibacter sp.]|nr:hypothetical protein [Methanobrevibacter sp.]
MTGTIEKQNKDGSLRLIDVPTGWILEDTTTGEVIAETKDYLVRNGWVSKYKLSRNVGQFWYKEDDVMSGYERNARCLREIFSYRMIKSDDENKAVTVPYEGSIYDFVKSKAKGKYKKLYSPEDGWARTPEKPVCGVVRMFASDDVQKVLLQRDDTVLFVPTNVGDWMGSYVYVYVKIPDEFATELENKILNKYHMKDYLKKFYGNEGIVKCSEGTYLRVNGLCNGMPDKEDTGHVFQHYGKFGCLASFERFSKHCEGFFNEDYYGGIGGIDSDFRPIFRDWVSRLWDFVSSQNYEERILEDYKDACDILQDAYEDERIAKEEAEKVKQAEAEATTQSYIDWVEQGNPVYGIYGWAWKGAQYNLMDPEEAISEIRKGRPFEIEYRTINGEDALVLQYVGENDLY